MLKGRCRMSQLLPMILSCMPLYSAMFLFSKGVVDNPTKVYPSMVVKNSYSIMLA